MYEFLFFGYCYSLNCFAIGLDWIGLRWFLLSLCVLVFAKKNVYLNDSFLDLV